MKKWQKVARHAAIVMAAILIIGIVIAGFNALSVVLDMVSDGTLEEAKVYEFDSDTDKLKIDISAALLTIRYEDCEAVTVKTNLKNLTVKESWGKLKINDNRRLLSVNETDGFVDIMIPEGTVLREIDLDLGAGETVLSSINAGVVDIDGGAGELLISRCSISELDLDMGVGELIFSGTVTRKADIGLGVGSTEITLLGGKENYQLVLEKGLGKITVDGEELGNGRIGSGSVRIDLEGGIGNIRVGFE